MKGRSGASQPQFSGPPAPSQPNGDAPLPPVVTTGAFLTGVLVDANGIALASTWISLADGARLQTDADGKFNLPYSNTPSSSYTVSVSTSTGATFLGDVQIPDDLKQAAVQGKSDTLLLKVQLSTTSSFDVSTANAKVPVVSSLAPKTVLADLVLGKSELTDGNAPGSTEPGNFDLFALTKSAESEASFALLRADQVCGSTTVFDKTSMPRTTDLSISNDMQWFRVCVRLTSEGSLSTTAQSQVFSVQVNPYVIDDSEGHLRAFLGVIQIPPVG